MSLKSRVNLAIGNLMRAALRPVGYTLTPLKRRAEYIDAAEIRAAAAAANMSVPKYVARLWNEEGVVEGVVAELKSCGALDGGGRTVEIGPGTGRYLEQVLPGFQPDTYEIYELDDGWAEYLVETHGVVRRACDGKTLGETADASCSLVQAHNVFVYLKPLQSLDYLLEMCRVCAPNGWLVFDYFPSEESSTAQVEDWMSHPERYQVFLPERIVDGILTARGFRKVTSFPVRCFRGSARYDVFRRTS